MSETHSPLQALLQSRALLGRWHAMPLSVDEAQRLQQRSERRFRERLQRGNSCFCCRLQRLIAWFWQDRAIEHEYELLYQHATRRHSRRALALLELIYGQLLASRHLPRAHEHLEKGFHLAESLLSPADYFVLLNRNHLLSRLPEIPLGEAQPLEALLAAMAVQERLEKNRPGRPEYRADPTDLYG